MKPLSMLLDAAREATGFNDFGDDRFLEGANRLVDALNTQAKLNSLGTQLLEQRLVMHLEQRLPAWTFFLGEDSCWEWGWGTKKPNTALWV